MIRRADAEAAVESVKDGPFQGPKEWSICSVSNSCVSHDLSAGGEEAGDITAMQLRRSEVRFLVLFFPRD